MNKRTHIYVPQRLKDQIADTIAEFTGSWRCVFIHTIIFIAWFVFRLDVSLLTNIVSLEAIYLCIFLLMSQNRQSEKDHLRDDHEAIEVDELVEMQKTQLEILELLKLHQPEKKPVARTPKPKQEK